MKNLFRGCQQTRWRSRAHQAWFRLCSVCLSVYMGYALWFAHSGAFRSTGATVLALAVYALVSLGLYAVLTTGCAVLGSKGPAGGGQRSGISLFVFGAAFCIAMGIFLCNFAACYPGGVNYDVSNQWRQAHSGEFNNWHPLMHTLLVWLITRLYDSYPFVILVQITAFSLSLAYLTAVLHRRGVPAWLALAGEGVTAITPLVRNVLMYAGKDSAMTIGVLLLTAWSIELLFTRGAWLKKPVHAVAFGLVLAVTTLLRHNGMMWTYVLLAGVFFAFKLCRRQAALAAVVMAAMLAILQGPVFGSLNVVYPDNFVDESMGIPMTILGDVKVTEPDKLDEETKTFLATLADDEEWQSTYRLHNYNSIKFTFDREYVARKPMGDLLRMTARTALAAPRTAFEAVNGLTDLVWGLDGANEATLNVRNSGDLPEANYKSAALNRLGGYAAGLFDRLTDLPLVRWLMQNVGVQLLLLLLVTLWALYRHGCGVLVLALPTLVYSLGTMMLLASNDARFFQFIFTISIPCMLAMLYLPKEESV